MCLERSVWLFMWVRVKEERQGGVQCDWLAGTVFYLHLSLRLKGILITLLQYRFSSLTFSLSFSCSEPNHTYSMSSWIPPTSLRLSYKFSFLFVSSFSVMLTNTQGSFLPCYINSKRDVEEDANKALPSTNFLFTQRAQQSPLATSILVYLPSVPSYDCHGNELVAMPVFRCHCVVFVRLSPDLCGVFLLVSPPILSLISLNAFCKMFIMWSGSECQCSLSKHPYIHIHTHILRNW